ncbi:MAG: SRPBCC family protein [Actinobacteria bacterium]|nr:SRPBCC family protein [Actinomycetota bacterium]
MLVENEFAVMAPIERVWAYLLDVERIAPCMPGAELTETVDESTWKGKVTIKLGPVGLSFAGTVSMTERDDAGHRVVLKAQGMEQRGRGAASALVTAWAEAEDEGSTRVRFSQDITVSGAVAQYSRGMMQDVSGKLTKQFADCLQANLAAQEAARPGEEPARQVTAKPVAGLRLGIWALLRAVGRFFKRIFGRRG